MLLFIFFIKLLDGGRVVRLLKLRGSGEGLRSAVKVTSGGGEYGY